MTPKEALERKAENARELGLNYEPQRTWEGFTEEEFVYFCSFVDHDILDQIENVLREKNELC
jgi:hypothetical protein